MDEKAKNMTPDEFAHAVVNHMALRPNTEFKLLTIIMESDGRPKRPPVHPSFPWIASSAVTDNGSNIWIVRYLWPMEMTY